MSRHRLLPWAVFVALCGGAAGVYVAAHAPLYNNPEHIDPWFYTGFFANFDFMFRHFHDSYYAARLPWNVPGYVLYSLLPFRAAFFVLHSIFYFGGALALFTLVRRVASLATAVIATAAFLASPIVFDANSWDYVDGGAISYMLAGMALVLGAHGRRARISLLAAGFALAAAVLTNLFALAVLIALLPVWWIWRRERRPERSEVVSLGLGALALLLLFGVFSTVRGGSVFFFFPEVKALRTINPAHYALPAGKWAPIEPRLLAPVCVASLLAVFAFRSRESSARWPLFSVAGFFGILAVYEFGSSGTFLQLPYYFSIAWPVVTLSLVVVIETLVRRLDSYARVVAIVLGVTAAAAPPLIVYGWGQTSVIGRTGMWVTAALIGASVLATAAVRLRPYVTASVAAVALAVFTVTFATVASRSVYDRLVTRYSLMADSASEYGLAFRFMSFMRSHGLQRTVPVFWYDQAADPHLVGLQSLYLYTFTLADVALPHVTPTFRQRVAQLNPSRLVLLCTNRSCSGAGRSLQHAGYRTTLVAETELAQGRLQYWVRAYALASSTPG